MSDEAFAVVTSFDRVEEAQSAVRELVAGGIGAEVVREVVKPSGDEAGDTPPTTRHAVRVVPDDLMRAYELLGLDAPEPAEAPSQRPVWLVILLIWLVAMVVIPAIAYWITVQVAS